MSLLRANMSVQLVNVWNPSTQFKTVKRKDAQHIRLFVFVYVCVCGEGGGVEVGPLEVGIYLVIIGFYLLYLSSRNICQAQTIIEKIKGGGHRKFHHQYPYLPSFFFYSFDFTRVERLIIPDHGIKILEYASPCLEYWVAHESPHIPWHTFTQAHNVQTRTQQKKIWNW